ncbi:MAG: hypothetical protein LBG59_06975 [Candidatus Peribacteria bacterium]|nr:hypothetical protein [Candidatus Peribacteria bacterium]
MKLLDQPISSSKTSAEKSIPPSKTPVLTTIRRTAQKDMVHQLRYDEMNLLFFKKSYTE